MAPFLPPTCSCVFLFILASKASWWQRNLGDHLIEARGGPDMRRLPDWEQDGQTEWTQSGWSYFLVGSGREFKIAFLSIFYFCFSQDEVFAPQAFFTQLAVIAKHRHGYVEYKGRKFMRFLESDTTHIWFLIENGLPILRNWLQLFKIMPVKISQWSRTLENYWAWNLDHSGLTPEICSAHPFYQPPIDGRRLGSRSCGCKQWLLLNKLAWMLL